MTAIFCELVDDCQAPPDVLMLTEAAVETVAVGGMVKVNEVPAPLMLTAELATVTLPTLIVALARKEPVMVTVPTPRLVPDWLTAVTVGACTLTMIDLVLSEPPAVVTTTV